MIQNPTGIIRTLPSLGDESEGMKQFQRSVKLMTANMLDQIYIALEAIPRIPVLHIYLLIGGEIVIRFNVAGYEAGGEHKCWDGKYRRPKYWAICTGPVSFPPMPIHRRGFQGFRYTEELW